MKYTILMGSPNHDGNTAALLRPFLEKNQEMGIEQDVIWLYGRDVRPCLGCKVCQNVTDRLGCVQEDDFQMIFVGFAVDCNGLFTKLWVGKPITFTHNGSSPVEGFVDPAAPAEAPSAACAPKGANSVG